MYLDGSTVTVSGASFTSCTASVRRTHNSRRHSHTAIAVHQPAPTYHTTPHSTTRRRTSHPPPSPPDTPLFPPRAKGRLLLPSVSCPTLAPVRSPILTLSRPSLHHHHQYHTITGPALPPLHPHSSRFFLPPPYPIGSHSHRLRPLATSHHALPDPLSNALLGGPLYHSVLSGRLRLPCVLTLAIAM